MPVPCVIGHQGESGREQFDGEELGYAALRQAPHHSVLQQMKGSVTRESEVHVRRPFVEGLHMSTVRQEA